MQEGLYKAERLHFDLSVCGERTTFKGQEEVKYSTLAQSLQTIRAV